MSIADNALAIRCNLSDAPEGGLQIEVVNVDEVFPYVDCDNKPDSIESILKRCIVQGDDGRFILQVHITD